MKIFRGLFVAWLSIFMMALIMTKAVYIALMDGPGKYLTWYGDTVILGCTYEFENDENLNYVKWHKDGKEFYIYDPNDSPDAQSLRLPGVKVDISNSGGSPTSRGNGIQLLEADVNTTGWYKCEVSTKRNGVFLNASNIIHVNVREPQRGPRYIKYDPDPNKDMTKTVDNDLPDLCKNATIDAIFSTADKSTYVFQGLYYWKLAEDGLEEGYPRKIEDDWDGLPGNIDAAFTYTSCSTYIFKGSVYWRYTNQILDKKDQNYPLNISYGYNGKIPDNVEAAFTWRKSGNIYFLKGDSYYRYVEGNWAANERENYPRRIDDTYDGYGWEGVPNNIDAVLSRKKMTYFFKGNYYYRYDNDKEEVLEDPQSTAVKIFGCLGKEITPKL